MADAGALSCAHVSAASVEGELSEGAEGESCGSAVHHVECMRVCVLCCGGRLLAVCTTLIFVCLLCSVLLCVCKSIHISFLDFVIPHVNNFPNR